MKNKLIILVFIFFSISSNSQNLKILKDSILVDSNYLILEELKINLNDEIVKTKIYTITQSTYDIFDKPFIGKPEKRIKIKKDTLTKRILENMLRESNSGFEHYEIYYDKNNIINLSIGVQSYGSPWEAKQYYCFDLNNGKRIGLNLFVNQQTLLKKIKSKLKEQDIKLSLKTNDLLNFKIITNKGITGIDFSIFDTENYRNSGYEEYIVHFNLKDIKSHILPIYYQRFN
ncbi:hypothetical protein [Flavobacterium sp.]|uniref:hypothetical protein n=1 Tax=Flavobacterium sp. TaxID=239 RepID=UPI003750FC92